ncbi:hypothetical protein LIA77_08647 [Sarocladium implicatum]|nr:hypothetical protein LIA77_08647 [Sarocladium implicatum]
MQVRRQRHGKCEGAPKPLILQSERDVTRRTWPKGRGRGDKDSLTHENRVSMSALQAGRVVWSWWSWLVRVWCDSFGREVATEHCRAEQRPRWLRECDFGAARLVEPEARQAA